MSAIHSTATQHAQRAFDVVDLPTRPHHYGHGPDLPVGTYTARETVKGVFTVERRIGFGRWYPLTQRDNPAWKTWPTRDAAQQWINRMGHDLCDWRHWGRA